MTSEGQETVSRPARQPAPDDASRLRALIALAQALAAAPDVDALVEVIAEEALRASGAASLSVSRWERERGMLRTLINVGELGPDEERNPEDECYRLADYPATAALLQRGKPYVLTEDDHSDPAEHALAERLQKGSQLGVPVMAGGEMWGELWATTRRGEPPFSHGDIELLTAIAEQVGAAVERGELLERVTEQATRDPLTGCANRRVVEEAARDAIAAAQASWAGVALLLADLDGLKAINDRDGHDAGDRAILQVARALEWAARDTKGALVGRLGGDEFCVLLPGAGADDARELAARMGERLAEVAPGLAVSWGVSGHEAGAATLTDLLQEADRELYAAKRRQRPAGGLRARLGRLARHRHGRRRLRDRRADAG